MTANEGGKKEVESDGHKHVRLIKSVGYLDAAALIIGFIIGSGIFISPQGVLKNVGSPGMAFVVWAATGAITTLENFCYIELALTFPEMGGEYIYIQKGFGDMVAFLYMWVSWVFMTSAGSAIIALTFSAYFCQMFWPNCSPPQLAKAVVAGLAMSFLVILQCMNPKIGYMTSNLFAVAKIGGLILIIVAGFVFMGINGTARLEVDPFIGSSTDPGSYVLGFFAAYWAFSGTTGLFQIMEEVKDPLKPNIIKSVLLGMSTVTVIYLLVNLSYLAVLSPSQILSSEAVAMTFGGEIVSAIFWLMPLVVALSTFGTMNNGILAGARTTIAASRQGHLPPFLGLLNRHKLTPIPAYLVKLSLGLCLLATSEVYNLIYYTTYIGTLASTLCQITLIMLRFTQPDLKRPFKLPLIFPIIFLILQIAFLIFPIVDKPMAPLICIVFVASGIPIYFFLVKREPPKWVRSTNQKLTHLVQKLSDALPEGALDDEDEGTPQKNGDVQQKEGQVNPAFDKDK